MNISTYQFLNACQSNNWEKATQLFSKNPVILEEIHEDINDLFLGYCQTNYLEIVKLFYSIKPELDQEEDVIQTAFSNALKGGYLPVAKWLHFTFQAILETMNMEQIFREVCIGENLDVAIWLLEIYPDINISAHNEYIFRLVCHHGHLEMAKWLISIKPDIDIRSKGNYAFNAAVRNGDDAMLEWLGSL